MVVERGLIYGFLLWAISFLAMGQEEYVKLEVHPSTVEKGMPVTVIIKTNVDGDLYFDVPDGFVKSGATHSGMSSSISYVNGKSTVVKEKYQQFTGYFEHEGKYRLGPAKIKTKKKEVLSEPMNVNVVKSTNMLSDDPKENLDQPLFGMIEQSKKQVYIGEPFVVESKVYAQIDVIQIEDYESFGFSGQVEQYAIQDTRQVMRKLEEINGKNVATFKLGKSVVFPEQVGTFDITPFKMTLFYDDPRRLFPDRKKIRSNGATVEVLPLPENQPDNFSGGVGRFKVRSAISDRQIKQGKVVELTVTVSGVGNLHQIDPPSLVLPKGVVLYGDPEIKESYEFSARGAEGDKTFVYYLQVNASGKLELPVLELSYFNLEEEIYAFMQTAPLVIDVAPDESFTPLIADVAEEEEKIEGSMKPVITENSQKTRTERRYFTLGGIALASSPLLAALLFIFVVKSKAKNEKERKLKEQTKDIHTTALNDLENLNSSIELRDFFEQAQQIVKNYLIKKWGVPSGELSRDCITKKVEKEELTNKQEELLVTYFMLMDEARYGSLIDGMTHEKIRALSKELITEVDR